MLYFEHNRPPDQALRRIPATGRAKWGGMGEKARNIALVARRAASTLHTRRLPATHLCRHRAGPAGAVRALCDALSHHLRPTDFSKPGRLPPPWGVHTTVPADRKRRAREKRHCSPPPTEAAAKREALAQNVAVTPSISASMSPVPPVSSRPESSTR